MTIGDLWRSCVRRWYVLALGLLLTVGGVGFVATSPGVYWARTKVILLGPPVPTRPNKLDSNSDGLIATAGVIEREMNASRSPIPATSIEVTLVDQGVYDGEAVRVPNYGGQWAINFSEPVLDLQASASSPAVVRERLERMIGEVDAILTRRQNAAAVSSSNRITFALSPQQVTINYSTGDRPRGELVAGTLGIAVSVATASAVDVLVRRRGLNNLQRVKLL
jgi:hypothetical protein